MNTTTTTTSAIGAPDAIGALAEPAPLKTALGRCPGCGETTCLMPLHGERGGPMRCPLCIGKWHGEHGKRRRHGRIVVRAIAAYLRNGGRHNDIDKLKQSAIISDFFGVARMGDAEVFDGDPLGYFSESANFAGENIELTSELLADAVKLAHPDVHPPERQDLARRTTQGLLALQPFVFPAEKPKPSPLDAVFKHSAPNNETAVTKESAPAYPCADCRATTFNFYCSVCRAEWNKRCAAKAESARIKQRKWYRERRSRRWMPRACAVCGAEFRIGGAVGSKRKDARFCSPKCRQKAHRVTAKSILSTNIELSVTPPPPTAGPPREPAAAAPHSDQGRVGL
jgi:hypothetical protein